MFRNSLAALALGMLATAATASFAADLRGTQGAEETPQSGFFFVHAGVAGLDLDEGARIYMLDARVPGGDIEIKSHLTFAIEAGYYFTPNIAVSFTGGFPPNVKIEAAGTMDGMGRIGATTYGPMTLTAHYHFTNLGRFQPYVGLGPAFMYVFSEKDGLMGNLKVDHTVGFAMQVGADYMLTEHWGVFVDLKKAFLRTEARGYLYGSVPIKAHVKLDPLVLHTGVTYRF